MDITVLLVDESPSILKCLHHLLDGESGIHIVGESGGSPEAIKLMEELHPKIIVMDMNMPDGTADTTVQIKSHLRLQTSQLIATSAFVDANVRKLARNWGAVRLIDKMRMAEELATTIRELAAQPIGSIN